jgi:hypothetical protein
MYARVSKWEGGDAQSIQEAADRISSQDGPPEGVPAQRLVMLTDSSGNVLMIPFFETEEDLKKGDETLKGMSPPGNIGELKSVEMYEVKLDLQAPQ